MRAQEKRNKPPNKAQKRNIMSTYLKNIVGYKQNELKNKSFNDIQKLFDKAMKRVNTFVDMDTELVEGSIVRAEGSETRVEGSSKRAGEELEQESSKKHKLEEVKNYKFYDVLSLIHYAQTVWTEMLDTCDVEIDQVWRNQQDYRVLDWKLHDSCGVHSLRKKNVHIHMLVEKRYPLTPTTIIDMLNRKLQADHWNEICYELLKLITK
ncbi:hypothetical protein Tco_1122166 [Tanacetum coccineum]|uniref:Uncharacterized protein n=1 Tax=Tanacetum coccineum TaxID=301880 RepID=A0ABQ5J0R8_9ASTR